MISKKIQESFSKGIVYTSRNLIVATYPYKDGWFAQSFEKEQKETIYDLVKRSDRLSAELSAGKSIKFSFNGDYGIDDMSLSPPLISEISDNELQKMIDEIEITDPYGLCQELQNVNQYDQDAISDAIVKAIDKFYEDNEPDSISFDVMTKWGRLYDLSQRIALKFQCEMDEEAPDENYNSYVELTLGHNCVISGDDIRDIREMISISSCVHIDGCVKDGFITVTFFV